MGGWVYAPREGFPQWECTVDWNVQSDVEAVHRVIRASDPLFVPGAVTVETALRRAHLPALREGGPLARLIAQQAEPWARDERIAEQVGAYPGVPDDIINYQHDPLACAVALGWRDGVQIRELPVETSVEDGWLRQRVADLGKPTRLVTAVDGPAFNELWLRTVVGI
jgi:inosine-uridine nucleoside N-ribohydrolase